MHRLIPVLLAAVALFAPDSASAYVGPGAGLSLLGALWALIAAVGTALFFLVAWPLRRMLRRRRAAKAGDGQQGSTEHAHPPDQQAAREAPRAP